MTLPKVVKLTAWSPVIKGDGDALTLALDAWRENTRGAPNWRGAIELKVDRYFVRQFLEAVAKMQIRDRERLARETERLGWELAPITKASKSPEET